MKVKGMSLSIARNLINFTDMCAKYRIGFLEGRVIEALIKCDGSPNAENKVNIMSAFSGLGVYDRHYIQSHKRRSFKLSEAEKVGMLDRGSKYFSIMELVLNGEHHKAMSAYAQLAGIVNGSN